MTSQLIRDLIEHPGDVCIAVDPAGQSTRIDTRVIVDGDLVQRLIFSEHAAATYPHDMESAGEFICMAKLSDKARRYATSMLAELDYSGPMMLYKVFDHLFAEFPSHFVSSQGRPWIEIDNENDYLRADSIAVQIAAYGKAVA